MSTVNGCRVTVVSTTGEQPTSRDERRKRTEATILDAARALFAESGLRAGHHPRRRERRGRRPGAGHAVLRQQGGPVRRRGEVVRRLADGDDRLARAGAGRRPARHDREVRGRRRPRGRRRAHAQLPHPPRGQPDHARRGHVRPRHGHRRRHRRRRRRAARRPARRVHDRPRHGALRARAPGPGRSVARGRRPAHGAGAARRWSTRLPDRHPAAQWSTWMRSSTSCSATWPPTGSRWPCSNRLRNSRSTPARPLRFFSTEHTAHAL